MTKYLRAAIGILLLAALAACRVDDATAEQGCWEWETGRHHSSIQDGLADTTLWQARATSRATATPRATTVPKVSRTPATPNRRASNNRARPAAPAYVPLGGQGYYEWDEDCD